MTFREAISYGERQLNNAGIVDARNDAWLLLTYVCKIDHTFYYVHMDEEMDVEQVAEYESVLSKRAEHVPLQYITGEQEFMGIPFRVNDSVLIPRQDTETLVEEALKVIRPGMKVLDMCTGSGCILISILKNIVDVEGFGYDISKQAINVAKENAKLNNVTATFERSDLFEDVTDTFDVIVSNPPYIPTDVIGELMPEVALFEPMQALDGKEDGLHFYRRIVEAASEYLNPNGMLLFEIGHDQGEAVSSLMKEAGYQNVRVVKDLAGNDRVVIGGL
ncbi:MAG: peptide chain release factor N(5)-glutamine methyltransferase [Lachnospiraceae bacterium]|nr:peptide chain release factor N(5)-glutamine methyltransferase [Agathobacter sp.]MBQ3513102.1 peptide chain release factor N(5)-glutamine methyltransferase [Lachnospiraceae bacterium]